MGHRAPLMAKTCSQSGKLLINLSSFSNSGDCVFNSFVSPRSGVETEELELLSQSECGLTVVGVVMGRVTGVLMGTVMGVLMGSVVGVVTGTVTGVQEASGMVEPSAWRACS